MKISYNWLQSYFEKPLPPIDKLDEKLAVHAFETEGVTTYSSPRLGEVPEAEGYLDHVIDIDVLPNRAHDALCHRGMAREVATLFDRDDYHEDDRYVAKKEYKKSELLPKIEIQNTEKCRRYMSRIIENVQVKESPQWLKERLESIGQRSINNVVDVTNYIMFDLGNPIHAFDADKVTPHPSTTLRSAQGAPLTGEQAPHIIIRDAKPGEKMKTLGSDSVEIELDGSMLVIACGESIESGDSEGVLALAGVKGGKKAEVDQKTTNLILEVANFEPVSTRKTRVKTGIATDSSKRFENEINAERAVEAMEALTKLLTDPEIAGTAETAVSEIVDVYPQGEQEISEVTVSLSRINTILGLELSRADVQAMLLRLRFSFLDKGDNFQIQVPQERLDIRIPDDVVEEIGRVYGYYNIPSQSVADMEFSPKVNKTVFYQNKVRDMLTAEGFYEVMTYSFQKKGDIEVANPVAQDKPALRRNLSKGIGDALEKNTHNAELFGTETVKMFEFGKIFTSAKLDQSSPDLEPAPDLIRGEVSRARRGTEGYSEQLHLALAIENKTKQAKKKYGEAKVQLESVVKKLEQVFSFQFSVFSSENNILEFDFGKVIEQLPDQLEYENLDVTLSDTKFKPFSFFPFMVRDIALWVNEGTSQEEIKNILASNAGELLVRIDLFDEFTKEGKTSFAFRMVFQSPEKTLSDEEMLPIMQKVESVVQEKGWEVR